MVVKDAYSLDAARAQFLRMARLHAWQSTAITPVRSQSSQNPTDLNMWARSQGSFSWHSSQSHIRR